MLQVFVKQSAKLVLGIPRQSNNLIILLHVDNNNVISQSSDSLEYTMTSLMNMAPEGKRPKVSKRIADILEYKEEFKATLAEEALTLPDRKPFSDKKSRNDSQNDVIVCARFAPGLEKEEEDGMLETFIARNPLAFAGELSFTFKNETRVQFKKYAADYVFDQMDTDEKVFETVGDPLVDIALAGGSGLFISYGQSNSGKIQNILQFSHICCPYAHTEE